MTSAIIARQAECIHLSSSFLFPAELILWNAGPEGAKNLAGICPPV